MQPPQGQIQEHIAGARAEIARLRAGLAQVIVGQDPVVEQVLWCLLGGGHVLLEGAPGLGKTLLVRTLAGCLDLTFSRIQFTPDLMPSDITGTNVLLLDAGGTSTGRFELHRGPVFGQLVLADEINRATPKTQSAMLEAMQEHSVTIAGQRHALPEPFMVLATENPIELEGTYPLPEAQLDRFLLKVLIHSPNVDQLTEILERTTGQQKRTVEPLLSGDQVVRLQRLCRTIIIAKPVLQYISRLVTASDPKSDSAPSGVRRAVRFGAGVRAAQALTLAAKARALIDGRANVAFEDIRSVAAPALRHRLILSFEGEAEGTDVEDVIAELLAAIETRPATVDQALAQA